MTELVEKLENSDANYSLNSERNVKSILNDLNWWAIQGPFYKDPKTKKLREIDTVAYKAWSKEEPNYVYSLIRLHLIVEVKSANNWHLLFSPLKKFELGLLRNFSWTGSYEDKKNEIAKILFDAGIPKEKISLVLKKFYKIHYPTEDYLDEMLLEL